MNDYEQKTIFIASSPQGAWQSTNLPAYVAECGLAYHQTYHGMWKGPTWSVTHVASGLILGKHAASFKSEYQCRSFIARIADLADWTQARPVLNNEAKAAINEAALACQKINYTPVF